jgi:ppGpp synthetase/RelA/SpoT-type nucleotidyltranferase
MTWVKPKFDTAAVNAAGLAIRHRKIPELTANLAVVNNWRAAHAFPLSSIYQTLNIKAVGVDPNALTSRRLKRFSSIRSKLQRMPRLTLYEMQDIGGARAILSDIDRIDRLMVIYNPEVRPSGKYVSEILDVNDYIAEPKPDGYRGVHVIFSFKGRIPATRAWNGLRIEVQIRTKKQHAWATTVETLETILEQRLRTVQGEPDWKRFLRLMASAIAVDEARTPVPDTPIEIEQLRTEILALDERLNARALLESYVQALRTIPLDRAGRGYYYLLDMRPQGAEKGTSVRAFRREDVAAAVKAYSEVEQQIGQESGRASGANAVLVSVGSIRRLNEAYPNYFMDTRAFLALYDQIILPGTGSTNGRGAGVQATAKSP